MKHMFPVWLALLSAFTAQAHFTFVVPEPGATKAKVVLSEDLQTTEEVDISILAGTKLSLRDASGKDTALTLEKAGSAYQVLLPGTGNRVVHGLSDLGVMQRGSGKAHVLLYYPKSILGNPFDSKTVVGGDTPVELVPVGSAGSVKLKFMVRGKPQPDAEITVIQPDGRGEKKVKTDANGETEPFAEVGRFGAWARYWEANAGEKAGKKYEELRHYATLVFDVGSAPSRLASLPQATSSFGAVEAGGWVYVYGGHISPTHSYFAEAVSGAFHRLNLNGGATWETLAAGPALQGLNLAAHDGKVYRVGGMAPRNKKGSAADNHSTAECARFDPKTGAWESLPPLPEPRSSHDVVVVGSQLIVIGGWTLAGKEEHWVDTVALMDLSAKKLEWKTAPQPFRRRALIAAAFHDKVYVLGGFDHQNQIVREVSIFDPKTSAWTQGPEIPSGAGLSFAPAAAVQNKTLYLSLSDGSLLRLNESRGAWEKAASATGRVAHRLVASGGKLLVIGGAAGGKNFDLVEVVPVTP